MEKQRAQATLPTEESGRERGTSDGARNLSEDSVLEAREGRISTSRGSYLPQMLLRVQFDEGQEMTIRVDKMQS